MATYSMRMAVSAHVYHAAPAGVHDAMVNTCRRFAESNGYLLVDGPEHALVSYDYTSGTDEMMVTVQISVANGIRCRTVQYVGDGLFVRATILAADRTVLAAGQDYPAHP